MSSHKRTLRSRRSSAFGRKTCHCVQYFHAPQINRPVGPLSDVGKFTRTDLPFSSIVSGEQFVLSESMARTTPVLAGCKMAFMPATIEPRVLSPMFVHCESHC